MKIDTVYSDSKQEKAPKLIEAFNVYRPNFFISFYNCNH